jgi:hypothetical protein
MPPTTPHAAAGPDAGFDGAGHGRSSDTPEPTRSARRGRIRWSRRRDRGARFGARLLVALLIAFAVIGAVAYVLLAGELGRNQLATYAALHRADVYNIEAIAKRSRGEREMVREIAELLAAIGRRPGTHEALLVGPDAIVRASGTRAVPTGGPIADPNVGAALRGTAYRGHEAGAGEDARNFNFIAPVDLPTGRFAFEVSYDHAFLDNNLGDVRRTLLLSACWRCSSGPVCSTSSAGAR